MAHHVTFMLKAAAAAEARREAGACVQEEVRVATEKVNILGAGLHVHGT